VKLFKESTRCDPALNANTYCSIELASFNRRDDNVARRLNVEAETLDKFLIEPYKEFDPLSSSTGTFSYSSSSQELFVAGTSPIRSKITEGRAVQVSSSGTLPKGLDPERIYYVTNPENDESPGTPQGVFFKLATSPGGALVVISDEGTGTHRISLYVPPEEPGKYGTLSMSVPTVVTDSSGNLFNTAEVLKSSGAEDIMGVGIDVAAMVKDFLFPPPSPPLADSGGSGPINWDYTLASLTLGPAVQLQTDFEMTWDLAVTEIEFSNPVKINGQEVSRLTDLAPPGTFHLTNSGPNALPEFELITPDPPTDPPLPVEVSISYVLEPKLKTVVSTPFIGQLDYAALTVGASISRVGRLGFGPLLEGAHKFKFGEFSVFNGDPSPIESTGTGNITFTMTPSGPPSFVWEPAQFSNGEWSQEVGGETNWLERISGLKNSLPGPSSDVLIDGSSPFFPTLSKPAEIGTLNVAATGQLNIVKRFGESAPVLTVGGGLVENSGTINVIDDFVGGSSLNLDSPDAVLCGPGTVQLSNGASLRGYTGADFTFCNYNTIRGVGQAMDQYLVNTNSSKINNVGTFRAQGGGGALITSANHILNQGVFESLALTDFEIYGDEFDSRVDSRVAANGSQSRTFLKFDKAEHAGLIRASDGGLVDVTPRNGGTATWNAGQSFTNDVGFFRAEGAGSVLQLRDIDMNGGCFVLGSGGALEAFDTDFNGSVFHIGDFHEDQVVETSGSLTLKGVNRKFNNVCLTNYGTVSVPGQVEFIDNIIFANNSTVKVPAGGFLRIHEKEIQTNAPGASPEAIFQPGAANATAETILFVDEQEVRRQLLVGGTWDIEGTLEIDGASFTGIGANAARASTRSASIDGLGGEAKDPEDDLSRVLSLGNPAKVILRGANWSFPALTSLEENGGSLHLVEGAVFPGSAPVSSTPDDFTNKGELRIEPSSRLTVGGSFIQTGAQAKTELMSGTLVSTDNNFQILGGTVTATADSDIFNRSGNTIPFGTTVRVESPLVDTNETDIFGEPVFKQQRVIVDIGNGVQIKTIAQGAEVTIHGGAVQFQALTNNLTSNAGTFTLSGDGIDNAPRSSLGINSGHALTNTGQVNVLGFTSELQTGVYTQNGASSATRIGVGANLILFGDLVINDGEIVLEIASRPRENQFGRIKASRVDFGNRLVINFIGELADRFAPVDIGDTWEIIPRTTSAPITGVNTNTLEYQLDGAPLPAEWLPASSHLEVIQFDTNFGKRGLGIRVVPDSGFKDYYVWAAESGFPNNFLVHPFQDADDNGIINGREFVFGLNGADGTASFQFVTVDGENYLQLSYVRPAGTEHRDATYTPYYSLNMVDWFVAPMFIMDISPGPGLNQQRVTLQSSFPITDDSMVFRVQANFNPEDFDAGLIPEKPINWGSGLDNLDQVLEDEGYNVSYTVEPGLVLFFNIPSASTTFGTVYGTGTYRDRSPLSVAAVHAGVLENGENGIVKVTILPRQDSFTGSTQNEGTNNQVTSQSHTYSGPDDEPNAISYRIEEGEEIIIGAEPQRKPQRNEGMFYVVPNKKGGGAVIYLE
jgi:hypothetical protein